MPNINSTTLQCNQPDKLAEILNEFRNPYEYLDPPIETTPGNFILYSANTVPHNELKELSKKHSNITFTAHHSFESNWNTEVYVIEYKNGNDTLMDIEPDYLIPTHDDYPADLFNEAIQIFKKMDVVRIDNEGEKYLDWIKNRITVSVENDEYRLDVTKQHSQIIDVKIYELKVEKNWKEITAEQFSRTTLPF